MARRSALLSSIATIMILQALPAAAQEAQAPGEADEIIVTAERRSGLAKDVPLTVTALTSGDLSAAGVTNSRDLAQVTPGLNITKSGAYVQPAIRGVTTGVPAPAAESNIATYVDSVYQASIQGAVYQLPDVRQIEVLKGPQGTLFGRNATGGAILITTLAPDLNDPTGMLSAGYGRWDTQTYKAYLSLPIVQDKLAVSVTGYHDRTDGWQRNLIDAPGVNAELENTLVRGKILFQPFDGARFTVAGTYSRTRDNNALKSTTLNGVSAFKSIPGTIVDSLPNTYVLDFNSNVKIVQKSIYLRGEIDAGPGTITTTTAFNRNQSDLAADVDGTNQPFGVVGFHSFFNTFNQEVLYTTEQLGRFRATAGAFYFKSSGGLQPLDVRTVFSPPTVIWQTDKVEAYAVFGEVKYDISDSLSVTGGVRYSHEKARGLVALGTADLVKPASLSLVGPPASWNSVTPRISVLYELSPQANLYFTFSKGFKSGAFNTASFQSTPVDPEKVTAFEGGIKGDLLSGLNIALSGFYQKYKDMQVSSLQQRPDLSFVQVLENAASSSMYGAELSGTWRVTDGFKLSFGGSYLHARYDNFPNAAVNVPAPGGNGLLNVAQDVSDKPMIRAPEFTGNISGVYDVETSLGRIELAASLFRSSSFVLEPSGRVKQPAYTNLNASIALWPNDMGIELKLYGKNLTNSTVIGQYGGGTTRETVNFTPPRSWGVEASYRF